MAEDLVDKDTNMKKKEIASDLKKLGSRHQGRVPRRKLRKELILTLS